MHVGINAGTKFRYASTQNLMTHNTSKFQVGGGLGSADIGVLVRVVKNENFPCPARVRALKEVYNALRFLGYKISGAVKISKMTINHIKLLQNER